jgi:hypothetical protein
MSLSVSEIASQSSAGSKPTMRAIKTMPEFLHRRETLKFRLPARPFEHSSCKGFCRGVGLAYFSTVLRWSAH